MNNFKKSRANLQDLFFKVIHLLLTNKFFFIALIVFLVAILTFINNLYFYNHVQYYAEKDMKQLVSLLTNELEFCRENRVSQKRYRNNMESMVRTFKKDSYYNDKLVLMSDEKEILVNENRELKDGVTASNVEIILPYLKSDETLSYKIDVPFYYSGLFVSVGRSMTFSLNEIIGNLYYNKPLRWDIYWRRTRPALGYAIFTFILLWIVRRRFYEFTKIEQILSALENKDTLKIKELIKSGVDINEKDFEGKTALMIYIIKNISEDKKESAIKILIENGANLDVKNFEGMTALMLHIDNKKANLKNSNIINILAKNGANLEAKNSYGLTALMIAVKADKYEFAKDLIDNGADTDIGWSIKDMAKGKKTEELFKKIYYPQKLVKLLTNFTIDRPIKYTTHTWEFGELQKEYGDFNGYMSAVKKQFDGMKDELETLSPNLYKKIYTFLLETNPDANYSWCSKVHINIGWSSLDGLKELCDSRKTPFEFTLKNAILLPPRKQIATFGEVINLFKQEIEIRNDFKNLESIFAVQKNKLGSEFEFDISNSKLTRKFYTDTQKLSYAVDKIFDAIKNRPEFQKVELTTQELEDRSIEIKITQIGSSTTKNGAGLLEEINSGDFADIKAALTNLCDWSIESTFGDESFRVNYLRSNNNVKEVEKLKQKPDGFTNILRFYV